MNVDLESVLDVYSLEDILEYNDLAPVDALQFMLDEEFITLPEIKPLEFE